MRYIGITAIVLLLAFIGCKKQETAANGGDQALPTQTTGSSDQARNGQPQPPALPPPPAHITAAAENAPRQQVAGQVDPFLTQQLQIYVKQTGHMPQSFAQFAGARLDSVPRPPPGTKWVIDTTSMEVKATPVQ